MITRSRQRTLILWLARLALFAYAFQLTAVDHWHGNITDISGVQGSSSHTMHCHGSPSSCAEQPGMVGSLTEIDLTPLPPAPMLQSAEPSRPAPSVFIVFSKDEPPRSV